MATLHVYVDESGNFTFSGKGSTYYAFAAVWTYSPEPLAQELTRLRFQLLKNGTNIQSFHACEDKQWCRNLFVSTIAAGSDWRFAAALIDKPKVNPSIRAPEQFYPKFLASILRFIFRGSVARSASNLFVVTDTLPLSRKREAVEKTIKETCRAELGRKPFQIFHHRRESNKWIQIADYCCWAIFRKWEKRDARTYSQLASHLEAPERDLLRAGLTRYY